MAHPGHNMPVHGHCWLHGLKNIFQTLKAETMQENEFEKQVKQRMDEFRLRPSKPVWTEIEKELRGKRRRRFILIPLFAVLLVAGYFGWQFYFTVNKVSSSAREISIKNNNNTDQNKNAVNKG